jgi:hypothetical protein
LDLDATDDPVHGDQEGAYYHGYYEERILHPLLVFDGETNQLITAVLRCGNTHASRGALAVLKRITKRLREEWPAVKIEIRADAGFAIPAIYEYCEREGIGYTIGLIPNPRLEELAEPLLGQAKRESERRAAARRFGWWAVLLTRLSAGAALGGLSTRRRCWRKAPTPASWSRTVTTNRKSSTIGT